MSINKENIIVFFDAVGRTIITEKISETDQTIKVKNPVIVHIVPNQQTGQMALQLFPAFFKEFQADKSEDTLWSYPKNTIATCDAIDLDFRLLSQYEQMFSNIVLPDNNIVTPQGDNTKEENVIKLFD